MTDFTTTWTKEELKIYMLIYCANANFKESEDEIDFIKSKIESSDFKKIHKEFEKDNDYQSIEKIRAAVDRFGYTKDDTDELIKEMEGLFASDDDFDTLEQNMFLGLKHILA
jgi:uncharacterized protein YlbG (UPF0298 family)